MTRLCSTLGLQFGFGFATADPSLLLNNHASKFCLHNIILQYPLQFPGNFLALLFPFLFAKFCIFQTSEGVRLRVLSSHILPCATPSRYAMLTSLAIGLDTPSLLLEGLWSDELKMQHAILRESRPAFNIITGPIFPRYCFVWSSFIFTILAYTSISSQCWLLLFHSLHTSTKVLPRFPNLSVP